MGYQLQHYVDQQFEGVNGVALRGQLTWYATQLITVTLHADRTFQDSGLPDTAAARVNDVTATVDYELLRNLIVTGTLGYTRYDYPGLDRLDNRFAAGLGATYLFSRSVGIDARLQLSAPGFQRHCAWFQLRRQSPGVNAHPATVSHAPRGSCAI